MAMEVALQLSDRLFSRLGIETIWSHNCVHAELDSYPLSLGELSVHGIINYQINLLNLDRFGYAAHELRSELKILGKHAAGVRVRFKTDSIFFLMYMRLLII